MALEIEARFRATGAALRTLTNADRLGPAGLGPPRTVSEIDRYLDTDDGRLAAAHWASRLRSRGDVQRLSLKGPPDPAGGAWLHRRPEVEGPATRSLDPATWEPSEARALLEELTGGRPLRERFRLDQRRTERAVVVGGRQLGTLSLDAVRIWSADRDLGPLAIVELELADPADADELAALAEALEAVDGLVAEPMSKQDHALQRMGEA
jgi:inorganic triphosphatase YgiF